MKQLLPFGIVIDLKAIDFTGEEMVCRIEVAFKPQYVDAPGESVRRKVKEHLGIKLESVRIINIYSIKGNLRQKQADVLRDALFIDPVVQEPAAGSYQSGDFDWVIEVGYRPGVTDNVARTSLEGISDILGRDVAEKLGVFTSKRHLLKGSISAEQAEHIASGFLANSLVQRWIVLSKADWESDQEQYLDIPEVHLEHEATVREYDLNVSDDELIRISREGILALELDEMKAIQKYFSDPQVVKERKKVGLGARPTDVELEAIAQTWSEHCKHKIFNACIEYHENGMVEKINSLFNTYIRGATDKIGEKIDWLVSVFHDNAGVIRFNDKWNLVMKCETHNTPSALDPYGGALTGIVGVNRDPAGTGIGCRLIFNTDVFCFAPPDYSGEIPPRLMHPKRVFDGVRLGVEHGGNKSGIPTINGAILFDDRYLGKPLVFCGTGGIMPAEINGRDPSVKYADSGDVIIMTGGRIGKDGIHGATFSSMEIAEDSPVSAVQIGDPITQKKMLDFLLEVRDLGLIKCLTDNGAGGLSSSVGETALLSGGAELDLDKAPLKYSGLDPWEALVSEAQERMTVGIAPEDVKTFTELAERRGVEATVIGKYTDSGKFHIRHKGKTVACMDLEFLHEGSGDMQLKARWEPPVHDTPELPKQPNHRKDLLSILSDYNVCSKEPVIRQYDHEVQGASVVKPLIGVENDGPGDAGVLRPVVDTDEGIVVSNGINPSYGDIDTYHMTACAIDEAIRNIVAVGGDPDRIAGLDNFCWPDPIQSEKTPDGEYKLAQLVRACKAVYDFTTAFGVPCISGKDSMKNDYKIGKYQISIPPTLLFSALGRINDVNKAVTSDAKKAGDIVFILGTTKNELGGSAYYRLHGGVGNTVPRVDAESAMKLYRALNSAIESGLVKSCHDCSEGGLAVALAETAFSGGLGMEINLGVVPVENCSSDSSVLFSESQSRFVVTVSKEDTKGFERALAPNTFAEIGVVISGSEFVIKGHNNESLINSDIHELKEAWQKPLRGVV